MTTTERSTDRSTEADTDKRALTRQQSAVAEALGAGEEFRSAQELHLQLRSAGTRVGLATVYRALQTLADRGDVDVLRSADGESLYRRCRTTTHHHHLICRSCRTTVDVDSAAVERWARSVATDHGFTDVDHVIEVYGTCASCSG